jgi:hypothetical protein
MNKKILIVAVALMTLAMLSTPVLANSTKRVPVDASLSSSTSSTDHWLRGDVQHGMVTISYGAASITGGDINLQDGTALQTVNYIVNVKGVPEGLREGKGVLHSRLEIIFNEGRFVGNEMQHGIFKVFPNQKVGLYTGSAHGLLRGTDNYRGWRLVFSFERIEGDTVNEEMYMFRP